MSGQIKFDLGSMIRQVEELAKAIEKLGVSTQSSFSSMASSTGTLGRATSDINRSVSPDDVNFITQQANNIKGNFARASIDRHERQQANIDAYQKFQGGEPGYFEDKGVLRYKDPAHSMSTPGIIRSYGDIGSIKKDIEDRQKRAESSLLGQNAAAQEGASKAEGLTRSVRMMPGASLASIPGALDQQQASKAATSGLEKAIDKLGKNVTDSNAKISADILKVLNARIAEKENELQKAKAEFADKPDDVNAQNRLANAIHDLTEAIEDGSRATKEVNRNLKGGGGDGQPPSLWDKLKDARIQFGAAALGAANLGANIAGQYFGANVSARNAVIGKELELQQGAAGLNRLSFKQTMESVDMRTGENILKYHGDMFYKGAPGTEFLGAGGFKNAQKAALESQAREHERDVYLRKESRLGAIKDMAIGAGIIGGSLLALGGSGGVSLPMSAAGVAIGSSQLTSGIGSLFKSEMESPASAREGITGFTGTAAKFMGITGKELDTVKAARLTEDRLMMANYSEGLRNAQVEQQAKDAFLINKQLEAKAASRAAYLMVGREALKGGDLHASLRYAQSDSEFQAQEAKNAIRSGFNGAVEKMSPDAIRKANIAKLNETVLSNVGFWDSSPAPVSGVGPLASGPQYVVAANNAKVSAALKERDRAAAVVRPYEESAWAARGLSEAEYIGRAAQVSSVMGGRRNTAQTMATTNRIIDISNAGMGDFGQIINNLGALNQTTGQADNTKKLEQLLSQAVALGFDKSRTGQQFVGAVTDLSRSLGVTETGSLGKSLGLGASILSATGRPNELSLEAARRGISEYAAYSSQSGGFVGAMKMRAAFAGGASFGTGAGILSGKSGEQTMSWLEELEPGKKITSAGLQDLLRVQGGDKEKVKEILRGQIVSAGTAIRGQFDVTHGRGAYESMVRKIELAPKNSKERQEQLLQFRAYTNEAAAQAGVSSESAMASGLQYLQTKGIITQPEASKQLREAIKKGKEDAVDPAQRNLQKYIDNQSANFNKNINIVNKESYTEYLKAGGTQLIPGVTKENIDKLKPEQVDMMNKEFSKLTKTDLAIGAEQAYSQTGNIQRVEIMNWRGLRPVIEGTVLGGKQKLGE